MTAKRRQTLQQRVISRWEKEKFKQWDSALAILNIRAEFDRLARGVRKLEGLPLALINVEDYVKRDHVLDLIKEQKR